VSRLVALGLLAALMFAFGCGGTSNSTPVGTGGGGGGNAQNAATITVDAGPSGLGFVSSDVAFVTVTVCVPGTTNCQNIDHVAVDTGSSGLRILKSGSVPLTVPLVQEGNLAECYQFVSSFTWGPVMMADVKIAGETASNIPIQVIGDSTTNSGFPVIPTACQNSVPPSVCAPEPCASDTLNTLGANGLLGVDSMIQDCGPTCASSTSVGLYYSCPSASSCAPTTVPVNQQVPNPVAEFASDNNGVLLELPAISSASGQATATGTMFFGIGTQSNNGLGNATIFHVDQFGNFTTVYNNVSYPGSFLDSGSNGIFFLTTALTGMPDCGGGNNLFYCPASTTNFTATNQGTTGTSNSVTFQAANVNNLPAANTAFNDLTGENALCFVNATTMAPCFDWGLSFFFGRNVYTAIEGQNTPAGTGPYWAY